MITISQLVLEAYASAVNSNNHLPLINIRISTDGTKKGFNTKAMLDSGASKTPLCYNKFAASMMCKDFMFTPTIGKVRVATGLQDIGADTVAME